MRNGGTEERKSQIHMINSNLTGPGPGDEHQKIKWPQNAELLQMLWEMPIPEVCRKLRLSKSATLKVLQELGLPAPGRGFWKRKGR